MQKFLRSSFFVLTVVALLAGVCGALKSGIWDLNPPPEGIFSFGSYFDGAVWGVFVTSLGLMPYWGFHALIGDISLSWQELKYKVWRVIGVVFWAASLGWFFSRSVAVT